VTASAAASAWRHPRSYERDDKFDPLRYLALIEQKINALDQGHPCGRLAVAGRVERLALPAVRRMAARRSGRPEATLGAN
jgi:hypothetical protein